MINCFIKMLDNMFQLWFSLFWIILFLLLLFCAWLYNFLFCIQEDLVNPNSHSKLKITESPLLLVKPTNKKQHPNTWK